MGGPTSADAVGSPITDKTIGDKSEADGAIIIGGEGWEQRKLMPLKSEDFLFNFWEGEELKF